MPDTPVLAVPGELIPDREVAADTKKRDPLVTQPDELGHKQIAQQLAQLAATVPERSNIALYGPWGSGKSGIGNLLRQYVEADKKLGYARFDAFKYAENPLRRDFISAVATDLKVEKSKYHADLYAGTTTTTFDVPRTALLRLAGIYVGLLFVIFTGLLLIAAAAAGFQQGGWWEDFQPLVKQVVVASFTPAALLSALIVLAGKSLGVEHKTDKAESSEQFEDLFKELVKDAGKDRIVVFVDELDRCAPSDVVGTLDAVRTFLGADRCVFVIAADRQAVEEALNKELKQATPADPVNPYYSSGSAYLDKVFQYQILVPPLLQASITRYAVELVKDRPGVWKELGDRLDLTVSILVPSHVRSPRRVKSLLNAFVLTYRLAEARQKDGRLHGDMALRSDEIARMVCLRVEFPLFARDLVLDARLPEYVLRLHKGETEDQVWNDHPHATPQARAIARGFAHRELPVATLLSDEDRAERDDEDEQDDEHATGADAAGDDAPQDVSEQHGRQFLDYLSRTRSVPGPGRDLLFMQSTGSAVGLDGQLAERLEEDAENASIESLRTAVRALDEQGRGAAVTLLIGQSLGGVGLQAQNVALSLLALAAIPELDVASRADALADAIAAPLNDRPDLVAEGGLHGAWRLGLHSDRPTAGRLREIVLRYAAENADDPDIAMMVLGDSDAAIAVDPATTADILVAHLLAEDGDAAAATAKVLLAMQPHQAARLFDAAESRMASVLRGRLAPPEPPAARAATPGRPAPAPPASGGTNDEPGLDDPLKAALAALLDQLDGATGGPAQTLMRALLKSNRRALRELVESCVAGLAPVDDPALAALLISACSMRPLRAWQAWLAAVSPTAAATVETDDAVQRLVNQLWHYATSTESPAPSATARAAATAVVALLDQRTSAQRPGMDNVVRQSLGTPVEDDDTANERRRLLAAAEPLLLAGALDPSVLAAQETQDLASTLRADLTVAEFDDPVVQYVVSTVEDALRGFPRPGVPAGPAAADARADLVQALHDSSWLAEPHATRLRLLGRMLTETSDALPALPNADAINDLRGEHGHALDDTVAAWIALAEPDAAALLTATDIALQEVTPSDRLLSAISKAVARYPVKERIEVLHGLLDDPDRPAPTKDILRAAGTAGARLVPDIDVARILAARVDNNGTSNSTRRRHLMQAWENAGIESEPARKLLFEKLLIPLFATDDGPASNASIDLGIDYLPRLAKTQPSGTKDSLGKAVVAAIGEEKAGKVLRPLGYKVSESGAFLWRRTKVDTSD
ncbi:KAP family P-loop NTPase fold protein [Vallicoccus soli]|nr:P-loop NTPase fold protein [Vallicoccus soli]